MSIGSSGRIVIEVEPGLKRELYAALARDGSTLKEWFLRSAQAYLSNTAGQMALPLASAASAASDDLAGQEGIAAVFESTKT
jgi:hypothetical protein